MAAIVLFDGACDLCNGTVRFILRRDAPGRFQFASQQSAPGQALLEQHGFAAPVPESVVVIDGEHVFTRSSAIIHILRGLGPAWRLVAAIGRLVPRPLRDAAYDLIARHRHLLGESNRCLIPAPEHRGRFLDAG